MPQFFFVLAIFKHPVYANIGIFLFYLSPDLFQIRIIIRYQILFEILFLRSIRTKYSISSQRYVNDPLNQ
jgi:hypothetical protein